MKASDLTRIQYSAKQASIANAWKKWIGQIDGLRTLDAVSIKIVQEKAYIEMAKTKPEWKKYADVVDKMNDILKSCVRVQYPDRQLSSYLDIKDQDRIYLIFLIKLYLKT